MVIVGLGYLILSFWNNRNVDSISKEQVSVEKVLAEAEKDTDNDGLLDWEEALWKTDPEIVDTDGDGISDGEEVRAGRNPKLAGACDEKEKKCSDKLQSPEEISKNQNSDPEEPSTFTAKIAQEFGKNYFAGKGLVGGESLSASAQQSLADSITLGIEQGVAAYQDVFTKEDIKISKFLSPKLYLNKLGGAFSKNFEGVSAGEMDIVGLVLSKEQFENTKLFEPLIEAYKNMVLFLQKETVPETYTELHLEILNIMQNILFAVRSMKNIEEDPAKAIVGVRLYVKETKRTAEFLKNLKMQIEKDGIGFSEQDGGRFFNQYFSNI